MGVIKWKIINGITLFVLGLIILLETFYKHIPFGAGLGDMFWYLIMYAVFTSQVILTYVYRNKSEKQYAIMTLIYMLILIYICLSATIWRGGEYPWNGKIFYG